MGDYDGEDGEKPPESLWERVLAEHRRDSSASKDHDDFRVFVLGSKNDAKDKLLAQVQGTEEGGDEGDTAGDCYGLGFSYCEFKDRPMGDDEDVRIRLLFTTVEKEAMAGLLPAYFLRPNSTLRGKWLESAVFIITIDLSAPHDAMRRLNAWYGHLETLIKEITSDPTQGDLGSRMRDSIERACDFFHNDPKTAPKKRMAMDAELQAAAPAAAEDDGGSKGVNMANYKKMGLFEKGNLGVPIIVVGTKLEQLNRVAESSQKDSKSKENFMTFIQANIRKWCIQRGAALIYTSSEKQVNCKLLREYLLFRLANIPMTSMQDARKQVTRRTPAVVAANDSLFIPAFADDQRTVAKLSLGQYADMNYEVVVPPPQQREPEREKAPPPEPFQDWLAEARKRAKEGGQPILGADRAERRGPSQASKALEHLRATGRRDRHGDPAGGGGAGGDKSLEHTAEAFFSNMIKTYRKGDAPAGGAAGRTRPSRKDPPKQ